MSSIANNMSAMPNIETLKEVGVDCVGVLAVQQFTESGLDMTDLASFAVADAVNIMFIRNMILAQMGPSPTSDSGKLVNQVITTLIGTGIPYWAIKKFIAKDKAGAMEVIKKCLASDVSNKLYNMAILKQ